MPMCDSPDRVLGDKAQEGVAQVVLVARVADGAQVVVVAVDALPAHALDARPLADVADDVGMLHA